VDQRKDRLAHQSHRFFCDPADPTANCGLTGRKIIVDTYGGAAPHGGGAFSGKDSTKVDRSAALRRALSCKNVVGLGPGGPLHHPARLCHRRGRAA